MKKILERFPWVQQAGCGVLICALLLSICLPLMGMRSAEPENPILDAAPQEITVLQAGQAPGHAGNGEAESKDAYGSGGSADSELTGEQEQPAPEETENQTEQGQDTQPEQQPKSKPQQEILADAAIEGVTVVDTMDGAADVVTAIAEQISGQTASKEA